MIEVIYIERARAITGESRLRAIAKALNNSYSILHYDDSCFVVDTFTHIDGAVSIAESLDNLYLCEPCQPSLIETATFSIIRSDKPLPEIRRQHPGAIQLPSDGIKFR